MSRFLRGSVAARARVCALLTIAGLTLVGCASIPNSAEPVVVSPFDTTTSTAAVAAPTAGRAPDLLVRDFLEASAVPDASHASARRYLTEQAVLSWDDTAVTVIDNGAQISAVGGRTGDKIRYSVRGSRVGSLGAGGTFSPEPGLVDIEVELTRVNGEWRIDSLPDGAIIERKDFEANYDRQALYFLGAGGRHLVPDIRWLAADRTHIGSALIDLLVQGPRTEIAQATTSELQRNTVLSSAPSGELQTTSSGGVNLDFRGVVAMDSARLKRLAAQVIWTLSQANVPGPYTLRINGELFDSSKAEWTLEDVQEYNPDVVQGGDVELHAIRNGALVRVEEDQTRPVGTALGTRSDLTSATISRDGTKVAAVGRLSEGRSELYLSLLGEGEVSTVLAGRTLARPTWDRESTAVWSVMDGTELMRVARSGSSSQVVVSKVDTSALRSIGQGISEVRMAPSGGRMAMIIEGRVVVATVDEISPGRFATTDPVDIAPAIAGQALSLDWRGNDRVVIGTSTRQAPIVAAWIDGSSLDTITDANIAPPVIVVASSPSTQYVLDRRALMQLTISNTDSEAYWREVPGMNGVSGAPVLPG